MSIGIWQIVLILVIVLILFGAGKIPRVMGDVAKGVKSFKAGLKEEPEDEAETAKREVPQADAMGAAAADVKSDEPAKT